MNEKTLNDEEALDYMKAGYQLATLLAEIPKEDRKEVLEELLEELQKGIK